MEKNAPLKEETQTSEKSAVSEGDRQLEEEISRGRDRAREDLTKRAFLGSLNDAAWEARRGLAAEREEEERERRRRRRQEALYWGSLACVVAGFLVLVWGLGGFG
jgi:hypothetical protein